MSKAKAQGTRYETYLVSEAHAMGLPAHRLAEAGTNDRGDVVVGSGRADEALSALAWKRLVSQDGYTRRRPDGEGEVFVLDASSFWILVAHAKLGQPLPSDIIIEAKARQKLNVTREMAKAKTKAQKGKT